MPCIGPMHRILWDSNDKVDKLTLGNASVTNVPMAIFGPLPHSSPKGSALASPVPVSESDQQQSR